MGKRPRWKRIARAMAWVYAVLVAALALIAASLHDYGLASWFLLLAVIVDRELRPPRVTIVFTATEGTVLNVDHD